MLAQIGLHHGGVGTQGSRTALLPDGARLQHVGAVGERQREARHLVHQQDRRLLRAQAVQRCEQILDHLRREAEGRLVQEQQLRLRHQAAREREHLLLAARKEPGALVRRSRSRQTVEQRLDLALRHFAAQVGAEADVVQHRELREHLAALGHQHHALRHDPVRREILQVLALESHFSRDRAMQSRERAHQRRLAGAVGAQHRDQLALLDLQIDVADHVEAP